VSFDGEQKLEIVFQNENVVAVVDGRVRALIRVLEADAVGPITTETLRCGQRVTVAGISTPALMRTPEALATFGPATFGRNACVLSARLHAVHRVLRRMWDARLGLGRPHPHPAGLAGSVAETAGSAVSSGAGVGVVLLAEVLAGDVACDLLKFPQVGLVDASGCGAVLRA
jgi:DNA-binding transcriptional LysR family regulator